MSAYFPKNNSKLQIAILGDDVRNNLYVAYNEYFNFEMTWHGNIEENRYPKLKRAWEKRDAYARKYKNICKKLNNELKDNVPTYEEVMQHDHFLVIEDIPWVENTQTEYSFVLRSQSCKVVVEMIGCSETSLKNSIDNLISRLHDYRYDVPNKLMVCIIYCEDEKQDQIDRIRAIVMTLGFDLIMTWEKSEKQPDYLFKEIVFHYLKRYAFEQLDYFDTENILDMNQVHREKWEAVLYKDGFNNAPTIPEKPKWKAMPKGPDLIWKSYEEMKNILEQGLFWDVAFIPDDQPNHKIKAHQYIVGGHIHYLKCIFHGASPDEITIDLESSDNATSSNEILHEVSLKKQELKIQDRVRGIEKRHQKVLNDFIGELCYKIDYDKKGRILIHTSVSSMTLEKLVQFCYTGMLGNTNPEEIDAFTHEVNIDKYILHELKILSENYCIPLLEKTCDALTQNQDIISYSHGFTVLDKTFQFLVQDCPFSISKEGSLGINSLKEELSSYYRPVSLDSKGENLVLVFLPLLAARSSFFEHLLSFYRSCDNMPNCIKFDEETYSLFTPVQLGTMINFLVSNNIYGPLENMDALTMLADFFGIPSLRDQCEWALCQMLSQYNVKDPLEKEYTKELDDFPLEFFSVLAQSYPLFQSHLKIFLLHNHYQASYYSLYSNMDISEVERLEHQFPPQLYEDHIQAFNNFIERLRSYLPKLEMDHQYLMKQKENEFFYMESRRKESCCVVS